MKLDSSDVGQNLEIPARVSKYILLRAKHLCGSVPNQDIILWNIIIFVYPDITDVSRMKNS